MPLLLPDNKWIEIDVRAVERNLREVKSLINERVRLIAVIKANAYGHGAAQIARILYHKGVRFFAVSFLYEALQLRKAGIPSSIMLLSPLVEEEQVKKAIKNNITLTIASAYDCELLNKVANRGQHPVTVHLKVDTGLGRFGLREDEITRICHTLKGNPRIYIEGIYTHMAEGGAASSTYTRKQFQEFVEVVKHLAEKGYNIPIKHCANSAVLLKYPEMHLNAVRVGTLLSGQYPAGIHGRLNLADPFKFKSKIIAIRTLGPGTYIGYNRSYRLQSESRVAVIPVGFNDGLGVEIANKPAGFADVVKCLLKIILGYFNHPRFSIYVYIKGRKYPVRGKIFMQTALVEVGQEVDIKMGDEVEVPMRKTLASKNLVRVYIREGAAVRISEGKQHRVVIEGG